MLEHMNKPQISSKTIIVDRKENERPFNAICAFLGEDPQYIDDNLVISIKVTYNKLTNIAEEEPDEEDEDV